MTIVRATSRDPCRWLAVITLSAAAVLGGCGSGGNTSSPDDRAVTIRTTACGDASRTTGSGVIVDDGLVLTAAHVVIGAADVVVAAAAGELPATIVLLDRASDLALLAVPGVDAPRPVLVELAAGDVVRMVGGATSGTVDAAVERRLVMEVDDVRSTTRTERVGYELDVDIGGGDSGAGVFDGEGRLVGIVFAAPTARGDASFAVGAREISAVLEAPHHGNHHCDPVLSRVVPTE